MAGIAQSGTVAGGDQATALQYDDLRLDVLNMGGDLATTGGTANVQTLAIDAQIVALTVGAKYRFIAGFSNTASMTLNINAIGAHTVKKGGTDNLTPYDVLVGVVYEVVWDGTNLQLVNPPFLVGEMKIWGTNTSPSGHLLCDGTAVSRTTYAALFAVIGVAFGVGDGATTFNLPNFKGKMPVGRDSGDANFDIIDAPTTYVGEKTHVLTVAELAAHTHNFNMSNGGFGGSKAQGSSFNGASDNSTTTSTGSDTAHNNIPPYAVINFIIKY